MRHLDLFSGIGGFALAAKEVWGDEYECIGFCDNNRFCQEVLKKRFPGVPIWGDIRTLRYASFASGNGCPTNTEVLADKGWEQALGDAQECACDLITGGFPCQPFSAAGKRRGRNDDRFLWPEMFRVIREFYPRWVIAENVRGILSIEGGMVFEQLCLDLEKEGYAVRAFVIPACAVNAPHRRDRVWIVAHSSTTRSECECGEIADEKRRICEDRRTGIRQEDGQISSGRSYATNNDAPDTAIGRCEEQWADGQQQENDIEQGDRRRWQADWPEVAARFCGVDDGLSTQVDGLELSKAGHRVERLKALGNAIVPQVAVEIMRAIKETEATG